MTCNPHIRQPIPVLDLDDEDQWIGMTDRARLIRVFDAAWEARCTVAIWQGDEPDAPEALIAWASARNLSLAGRRTRAAGHDVVLELRSDGTGITVYILATEGS